VSSLRDMLWQFDYLFTSKFNVKIFVPSSLMNGKCWTTYIEGTFKCHMWVNHYNPSINSSQCVTCGQLLKNYHLKKIVFWHSRYCRWIHESRAHFHVIYKSWAHFHVIVMLISFKIWCTCYFTIVVRDFITIASTWHLI